MAIKIADFPIKNGDSPWLCKPVPEGTWVKSTSHKPLKHRVHPEEGKMWPIIKPRNSSCSINCSHLLLN